jgi:hypothetical protein
MPQKLQIIRLVNLPRPHRYTATMAARSRRQRQLARPPTLTLRKHYRDEGLAQHLSRPGCSISADRDCSISADRDCSISADRVPASQQTGTQHLSRPGLQPCLKAQPRVADQMNRDVKAGQATPSRQAMAAIEPLGSPRYVACSTPSENRDCQKH